MQHSSRSMVRLDSSTRDFAWNFQQPKGAGNGLGSDGDGQPVRLVNANNQSQWDDPLDALRWIDTCGHENPQERWVGWISYDLGRFFDRIPDAARDDLQLPLFRFSREGSPVQPITAAYDRPAPSRSASLTSTFSRDRYMQAVAAAIEYIKAGDVFQVNLSQRFTVVQAASASEIYDRLRQLAPAAYGALLEYDDFALICNSPELFFRVTPLPDGRRKIITRPIKGTRPRMPGMDVELLHSAKDQAELNMIIDLERNDLGRICEIGTVKVVEPRTIEMHPTVYHGVATIEGILRQEIGFIDILRAMFPGGSVTGAPKIRAMQIIEELEPVRRGPYCGAIGYIAADGSMEFNIAIRTMIVKDGLVHIPVGGGVVADSNPADEYEETLVKAGAMFTALAISAGDLERLNQIEDPVE